MKTFIGILVGLGLMAILMVVFFPSRFEVSCAVVGGHVSGDNCISNDDGHTIFTRQDLWYD